ncbi:uncharacterized protein LOC135206241 isoform X2 [Macrobrachium nipponense]|uniref:uncharacterized protein LOC135206241 isoform X2 n=1 Tax=Macrobrachium nipponense TaxID=159736 RepID=UPI0030C866DA
MEVESRVSVQAMRGKFEQTPEAIKLCSRTPASKTTTTPGRARASSLIISEKDRSFHNGVTGERLANSVDKENECFSKTRKHSPNGSVSKTKSIFSDIVSPMLSGSKVTKALSPKKLSVDNIKSRKISSEKSEVSEDSLKVTPSRKVSDNFTSDSKPSVVRRIPVFKSFNGGIGPEEKTIKTETAERVVDSPSRREKFLGHIRSRSHGNVMISRDPSIERNESLSNNAGNSVKPENGRVNFFDRMSRQKSSDNLYGHRDPKSSSPFEGKQKIVANVVKNMKNKEKPKVLRKFSFSSKHDKEIKTKKEKVSSDKEHDKQNARVDPCTAKMEAIAKLPVNEKLSSVTGFPVGGSGTVSMAKAVADIALVKSSTRSSDSGSNAALVKESSRSPETKNRGEPTPEETSPPARPPRRRSATAGLIFHKKGIAPSPPGPPVLQDSGKNTTSPEDYSQDMSVIPTSSFDNEGRRSHISVGLHKSMDPLLSPQSSDVSLENSPASGSVRSPLLKKQKSKSSITVDKLHSEDYSLCDELDGKGCFTKPPSGKRPENVEHLETDSLPMGPPPRKPPRTFAYDIYKSSKENRCEDVTPNENGDCNEKLEMPSPSAAPVYAVPLKKKKSENKLTPKPPVRSNSDLSKRDLIKPSVAPKPPHIINKVKRTSVVDPLSCNEKGEEAAMTSEFQRQAHIRYSLRRPKKPPPAPPPNSESEGSILNDALGNSGDTRGLAKSYAGLNGNCDFSDDDCVSGSSPHLPNDSRSSPTNSMDMTASSRCSPDSVYSDGDANPPTIRITSRSSYNLHVPGGYNNNEPLSLGHCPTDTSELTGLYRKRSMSDETLYKGSKYGEEPIYAMPIFTNSKGTRGHHRQRELHYMGADGGRDGCRRNGRDGETGDGTACKAKSSIISVWKREFRQSCRQMQNKIKKTVNR